MSLNITTFAAVKKYMSAITGGVSDELSKLSKKIADLTSSMNKADSDLKNTDLELQKNINTVSENLKNLADKQTFDVANIMDENLVPLMKSAFNSFNGGFRMEAGVLEINAPGIYMVMQAGSGNKNIIIEQEGEKVLNETWNGVIVLSGDNGLVTPVGIKTGLTQWATPGTFQGWLKGSDKYKTTISYPKEAVVWYMGNVNNIGV